MPEQPDQSRKPKYHHGNLREALIEGALRLLEEDGLEGLTLRRAAKRAEVSHAAPAHHFGDLRGLLAAVAERGYNELLIAIDEARGSIGVDAPPLAEVELIGKSYVRFAAEHKPLFRVMLHPQLADKSTFPNLEHASMSPFARLFAATERAQRRGDLGPGDPRALSLLAWSTMHGLAALVLDGQVPTATLGGSLEGLSRETLGLLFDNLSGPVSG